MFSLEIFIFILILFTLAKIDCINRKTGKNGKLRIENCQKLCKIAAFSMNASNSHNFDAELVGNIIPIRNTKLIDDTKQGKIRSNRRKRSFDYDFNDYGSYNDMLKWMEYISQKYRKIAKLVEIGTTFERRKITGLKVFIMIAKEMHSLPTKIGKPNVERVKRAVYIDGGNHAREWPAFHTVLYIINELVTKYGRQNKITNYIDSLDFYLFPCLNPDGYEYSRTSTKRLTRMWRKNRSAKNCSGEAWGNSRCCNGVDLNRNFDYHWAEKGASSNPCSDIFHGGRAFSEPESRAVRDLLLSPELDGKVDAFITFHTYGQFWIHPFSHNRKAYPDDVDDLIKVGEKAIKAVEKIRGTKYKLGTGADIIKPASGTSEDWVKANTKIKYVYLVELPPSWRTWFAFIMNKGRLISTGREALEGVKVVIDAVLDLKYPN